MGYRTREAYNLAKGREDVAAIVGRRTVEALRRRGIANPDPTSAVYKKEFNRLSAIYRDEQTRLMKDRRKREAAWRAEHANDTDEELLAYLREAVTQPEQLKKTTLVTGGPHIAAHFGGWQKALALAGLVPPQDK
jgi:hypothetical protein